jgi:hypothetical protein
MMGYDVLYQKWLVARSNKDYALSDKIRDEFEKLHGLTIFAEGEMPIVGVTVRTMKASAYYKKYGVADSDRKVGEIIATQDSYTKSLYPHYEGMPVTSYAIDEVRKKKA